MNKPLAAVGSLIFFLAAPGTVAVLIPWLLTGWEPAAAPRWWWPLSIPGVLLVLAGAALLVHSFMTFVIEGLGTPAPVAPPSNLVVGGLYRYVRNPMYIGLIAAILGQALWLWRWELMVYAAAVWVITASYVKWREEPVLAGRFGKSYQEYRDNVPAWIPRLRP
jgi:protein-S-isoprenylcysteine O-methyltransferase Ste14